MQVSTVSERIGFNDTSIEAMKWLGFVAMLVEHVSHFAFGMMDGWPFVVGRLAFPLFTVALAVGLAGKTLSELGVVVQRLLLWGVIAHVCGLLVREALPMNVLFTFALGVMLHMLMRGVGVMRWLWVVLILLASLVVEYKAVGVLAVAAALHGARQEASSAQACWMGFALLMIAAVKFNSPAIVALPVVFAINAMRIEVPRSRGLFYYAYAGHWPLLGAMRAVL